MNFERSKMILDAFGAVFGSVDHQISPYTFPRGGQYQIELVGPNSPATFEKLLDITRKENIPVHRVVGTLGGFGDLSDDDLKAIAKLSESSGVEFVGTPISPLTNIEGVTEGRHPCQGSFFGLHLRGIRTVEQYLYQMLRGVEQGLRTFLIWDFAAFDCAEYMKSQGKLPCGVNFKVSVFAGSAHSRDCENWAWRHNAFNLHSKFSSISSLNPVALLTDELGAIRRVLRRFVPLDIHCTTLDSMGGIDRALEMPDIIRWASPVNVKIERGAGVEEMMNEQTLFSSVIPKVVESTKKFVEYITENHPDIKMEPLTDNR